MSDHIDKNSKVLISIMLIVALVSVWFTYKHFVVMDDFFIEQSEE